MVAAASAFRPMPHRALIFAFGQVHRRCQAPHDIQLQSLVALRCQSGSAQSRTSAKRRLGSRQADPRRPVGASFALRSWQRWQAPHLLQERVVPSPGWATRSGRPTTKRDDRRRHSSAERTGFPGERTPVRSWRRTTELTSAGSFDRAGLPAQRSRAPRRRSSGPLRWRDDATGTKSVNRISRLHGRGQLGRRCDRSTSRCGDCQCNPCAHLASFGPSR